MTPDTLLFRQVNPSWIKEGQVTSQLFRPTRKDEKRTSVYDGDQVTAQESYCHYTVELGYRSVGVVAVTVTECEDQNLTAIPDPDMFPAHALIDFRGYSNNDIIKKAICLKRAAMERGWQYCPGP